MFKLITVALTSLLLSVSCTKKQKTEYGLDHKETLKINITTEPPTLDWSKSTDTTSALIQDNIMEGLVDYNFDDPDLSLKPSLAKEWSSTNKEQTWTFTLRKGVKWTDGVELTPQHVVDGWERLLSPATASEYAYFLYGIKNASKYNKGEIKDFKEVGVKINDKGQIVVELEGPQSYFPYLLTHHCTYPVRKDIIAKHGDRWTNPANIVTLGAYNLKTWEHDKAIVLERNENYYGEKAKTKNILAYMIKEASTAITLFETGKLDVQGNLPSAELKALKKKPEFKQNGILLLYYYGMNTTKPPLNNVNFRKAISHAINRDEITTMLDGGQKPMTSWVPPGMFGFEPEKGTKFNPSKAKEFLAKAGYNEENKPPKIELAYNTNEDHKRIAENVQAQLKKHLGVTVEIKNEEWKSYLGKLKSNTPHIYRMGWVADFPDPDNFLNLMTSYSDNNHTNWGNPQFDTLIKKAVSVDKKEERRELYSKAQKILTEQDVPVIPIYSGVSHLLINKRVQNYPMNVMGRRKFKEVVLK